VRGGPCSARRSTFVTHLARAGLLETQCLAVAEFVTLRSLLPDVLARLSSSGSAGALQALWQQLIGGPIAQNSRPLSLSEGVLRVEVASVAWRATLQAEEPALKARLNAALRSPSIERLEFEVRSHAP
jgi:predicted nucleic acid-binding Zn ribbon protein